MRSKGFNNVSLLSRLSAYAAALLLLLNGLTVSALGASADKIGTTAYNINLSFVYGLVAAVSLVLVLVYRFAVKHRERWLLLLFNAVFIVNAGYFLLSVSRSLDFALWANRVSYLGSVFLPFAMLMRLSSS